jgi:hypothetical protein
MRRGKDIETSSSFFCGPILSPVSNPARARRRIQIGRIPVRYIAEGCESVGQLKNVSRAGAFVCATELPRAGATVTLHFESPSGEAVNLRGEVRWSSQGAPDSSIPTGFGILLREPPREYRDFFLWILDQAEKDGG